MMNRTFFFLLAALAPNWTWAQTSARDSLLLYLEKNESAVHKLVDGYNQVSFNWAQLLATFGAAIILIVLTWRFWGKEKLAEFVRKKSEEAVMAMNNLKTAKILVLSNGDDEAFLKSFFKAKGFLNTKFIQIADKQVPVAGFDYDVVFTNNDNESLDKSLVRKYIKEDTVLFYFGKPNSWDWQNDNQDISRKINFANSRAQIYGNLMSSLEFLELVRPKIKNV